MEDILDLIAEISRLLNGTLSCDKATVDSSADGLDRLSALPAFRLSLLTIAKDGDSQGLRIASATYLKNFTRKCIDGELLSPETLKEFRNQLAEVLLTVDQAVLRVLIEAFHLVIAKDFVKENSWPELIPQLKAVIQNSDLISLAGYCQWKTLNALTMLQAVTRPFQYFLNPKVPKEPVPEQLEHVATEILAPLQATFHHFVDKVLSVNDGTQGEYEQALLILCKSMYFAVRSYMPSALIEAIPSFCHNLMRILDALRLDSTSSDKFLTRLKIAKRGLIIFCTLVTRHRKHTDELLKSILNSAINIARQSIYIGVLDSPSDRIISLSFDVISHVIETGPGWRLVSSHFSSLLDSAIFPALSLNQKDISEWDEDPEEYIRKNLPSELDEASGWAEDLFTARKSAINLLGVIAMSKGPPAVPAASKRKKGDKNKKKQQNNSIGELLVVPFLSKFSIPSDGEETSSKTVQNYYGVLKAYGGLQDFLKERTPEYTATLIHNRVLPLYSLCKCTRYLVATSNWLLGELAPCLPQAMSGDIYNALTKALVTPDTEGISSYPVRASAAGALASLLDNEHFPSDWLSLLQTVIGRIGTGEENESSILFQLIASIVESGQQKITVHVPGIVSTIAGAISRLIPPIPSPWPQGVEKGVACLVVLVQTWVAFMPDDSKQQMSDIALVLSNLLQQAWLIPVVPMGEEAVIPPPSAINDASMLLGLIIQFTDSPNDAKKFKIKELLAVFADIIADYHAWEEMEDQGIFNTIKEAIYLGNKLADSNSGTIITSSFIEGVSNFISEGINAYASATLRACTCVHVLLHVHEFFPENEELVRRIVAVRFASAAFLRLKELSEKKAELEKTLILAISSCYLLYPESIERILEERENGGYFYWASKLASISRSCFEPGFSTEAEAKLAVLTLAKVVDRLLMLPETGGDMLVNCFVALMEVSICLNELQEEDCGDDDDAHEIDDDDDDSEDEADDSEDEDTEDEMREETEEEFLSRYAAAAQNSTDFVDEEDIDDDEQIIDIGNLDETDAQTVVRSLVKKHQVLAKGELLSQSLINRIYETFPEYQLFLGVSTKS